MGRSLPGARRRCGLRLGCAAKGRSNGDEQNGKHPGLNHLFLPVVNRLRQPVCGEANLPAFVALPALSGRRRRARFGSARSWWDRRG